MGVTRFALYSPVMGSRQDYPNILLDKAFTPDNRNVQLWNGEIRTAKKRTPELLRTIYACTVNVVEDTITIPNSDYTAFFDQGDSVTIYDQSQNYQSVTLSTTAQVVGSNTVLTSTTSITVNTSSMHVFEDTGVVSNDPASDDFLKVGTPDSNEIIRYQRIKLSDASATERLIAFTVRNVYFWNSTTTSWGIVFAGSSDCLYWDSDQYGDYLVATNNVDRPIQWDGSSATTSTYIDTQYGATTSIYVAKAAFIKSFQNYIFLGNVELSNGQRHQHDVYHSSIGEGVTALGFQQTTGKDAGSITIEGSGNIAGGFGLKEGYLYVFKRWSIRKMWFTGGAIPFEANEANPGVGCMAPGSVVNDESGNLYYYGSDKAFREMNLGRISQGIFNTARDINPNLLGKIRSTYIDEYDDIWWAIPSGSNSIANNKIVKFHEGLWVEDDIAVTAFGKYSRQQNWTWDTIPFASWDEWGWDSWDSTDGVQDFLIDLCSDSSGYTYAVHGGYKDDGSDYTSYAVLTTDFSGKQALPFVKRTQCAYLYVRNAGSGTLELSVKRDNEPAYESLGSVSMNGEDDILRQRLDIDIAGRHFLFKVSSTTPFHFIGIEFEFVPWGDR